MEVQPSSLKQPPKPSMAGDGSLALARSIQVLSVSQRQPTGRRGWGRQGADSVVEIQVASAGGAACAAARIEAGRSEDAASVAACWSNVRRVGLIGISRLLKSDAQILCHAGGIFGSLVEC